MQTAYTLSIQAAAKYLNVSRSTFDRLVKEPTFPRPTRIGQRSFWCPEHIATWLEAQRV